MQMANRLTVEGALPKAVMENAPDRLEISVFLKDIRQFSLYIQALEALYNQDRDDPASFWQIAGIHGQPYVDYNGTPCDGEGYCVHGTDLFLPWHRPYVVLFEQEIQKLARQIASKYTYDRILWEASAATLRQPYWGWDRLESVVPPDEIIVATNVRIMKPDRKAVVFVPNPFLTYYYPKGGNSSFIEPFSLRQNTARYPSPNWSSQPTLLKEALRVQAPAIVENTRRLFSVTTWHNFTLGSRGTTGLEGIHNTIHVTTGGPSGNMAYIEVAGKFHIQCFDPLFWLHHAQVDRIADLWQKVHRLWATSTSDLLPFRKTQTTYWKSSDIVDASNTFNYRYGTPMGGLDPMAFMSREVMEHPEMQDQNYVQDPTSDITLEWSIRIQCKQFELGGSFSVYIFLSPEVPPTPAEWLFDPAFAGTIDVFANTKPDQCANCTSHADDLLKGFVHINRIFKRLSGEVSIDPNVVLPYLRRHLSWGVLKGTGEVVDVKQLQSLEVTVMYMPLMHTLGSEYPIEGEPMVFSDITRGRTGGHCYD